MKSGTIRSTVSKGALVVAVALLAYALYSTPLDKLSSLTLDTVASATVSMSAGVPPNPYNTAAEQLSAKEAELAARENRLTMQGVAPPRATEGHDTFAVYSLLVSIALFILVAINFFFDWRRGQQTGTGPAPYLSLDLRRRQ